MASKNDDLRDVRSRKAYFPSSQFNAVMAILGESAPSPSIRRCFNFTDDEQQFWIQLYHHDTSDLTEAGLDELLDMCASKLNSTDT